MPKKKVDNQQGVRFEFQDSERKLLTTYAYSNAFKNVGVGVGAVLKPIADNFAVLMAAWLAKEGLEGIEGKVAEWQVNAENSRDKHYAAEYQKYIDSWIIGESNMTDSTDPWSYDEWMELHNKSGGSKRGEWWKEHVGDPMRRGIALWVDTIVFWK